MGIETAILGISSAIGAVTTAVATSMQIQVANMNADIERENAVRAVEIASVEQQEKDFENRAALGEQIAAQADSGVAVEVGTPVNNRAVSRRLARLDALNIQQAGRVSAYNHLVNAASIEAQGKVDAVGGYGSALGKVLEIGSAIGDAKPVAKKHYYPVPTPRPKRIVF